MRSWLAATPSDFRFSVKGQRGATMRALLVDAPGSVAWLLDAIRPFGDRLGTVLFRVPADVQRDDARLAALLDAWPADVPLTMEFQDPSWLVDEILDPLRGARSRALRDRARRASRTADAPPDRALPLPAPSPVHLHGR